MNQFTSVGTSRARIPPMRQDRPAKKVGARRLSEEDQKVHAFIRLTLLDFERRHGAEATERLRQQLVDLARTELFPGDEIADFGNGQLCILLRDRDQNHVLFVAQSLQYFLQGTLLHNREYNITVMVTFFDETMVSHHDRSLCKVQKMATATTRQPENRAYRVTVLSDQQDLALRLERSLSDLQIDIMHVETIDQADTLIDFEFSDMTIVDINRAAAWPGLVFQHFDSKAEHHHVLMMCDDAEEMRHYRERSVHAADILPIQAIDSPHFPGLVLEALKSCSGHGKISSALIEPAGQGSRKPASPGRRPDVEIAA